MNMKYFCRSFSFGVPASLIFVIQFEIPSQVQITHQNIQGLSSDNFYTLPLPLNRLQKESIHLTAN